MSKTLDSPRKQTAKGMLPSPRATASDSGVVKSSPLSTPRTPRAKMNIISKLSTPRTKVTAAAVAASTTAKVEVMELPARIGPGINLKLNTSNPGDRIRNGGGGDSCLKLPLECLSKAEISEEMKESTIPYHHLGYYDDENSPNEEEEEEEEEELEEFDPDKTSNAMKPDKARFNIWKGINYDLHLLGDFKSDFERRVKSFQRPETLSIQMDPFCREESGLKDEPSKGDAFLVWKSESDQWEHSYHNSQNDITSTALIPSEEEENEQDNQYDEDSDADSIPDPEMMEYIKSQKDKIKQGLSPSGENLYYDEECGVVRNLHRESHSLTNYGMMPDDTWIGKAHIFYPEMSEEEKKMLKAVVSRDEGHSSNKNSPRVCV